MTAVVSAVQTLKTPQNASFTHRNPKHPPLRVLQLGMSWFAEKPGGLDRYFSELLEHLPEAGVTGRGIVMGSKRVSVETDGNIIAAAEPRSFLWTRWNSMRRTVAAELADSHYDLVTSHHSLYTAPVLGQIKQLPLVVHFHGPFGAESSAENSRFLHNAAKHLMDAPFIPGPCGVSPCQKRSPQSCTKHLPSHGNLFELFPVALRPPVSMQTKLDCKPVLVWVGQLIGPSCFQSVGCIVEWDWKTSSNPSRLFVSASPISWS